MSKENGEFYDYPTEPVPQSERRTLYNLSVVTAGLAVAMSTLYTGASLAQMLTYKGAVISILIGCCVLFLIAGILGAIGTETGVCFSVLARHSFGRDGSKIIGLIWTVSLTGWYAYQCGFFGETINLIWPDYFLTQPHIAAFWGGLVMMTTAIIGYKGLSFLSSIASPLIFIMCLWGSIVAFNQVGLSKIISRVPKNPAGFGTGITIVIGGWIIGAIMQPDVARYAKSKKDIWLATGIAMIVFAFANFAGMTMTKAVQTDTIMAAMIALQMGIAPLFIVILAQWTSNDNNLYSASLGVTNVFNFSKHKVSLVLGIAATVIATFGIEDLFVPFLNFLGTFIPPIGGIIMADYYLLNKKDTYTFDQNTTYKQWNLLAFITILLSALIGFNLDFGISAINSLISGSVIYWVLMNIAEKKKFDPYYGRVIEHK
ncbi:MULTISPECIES: cytosine permease [unclassified Halanaerobium]|uniref:cytosine permease n=1 Tax=unclassified Halanaerobium TaxID=2641197 RepID=UPI000E15E73B|nr:MULTISPECIES: cytosine permease [unclassified Halanaerobium]RCW40667.1 cytosine permease [Halanaerobium sp. MA284_MarDTE_T2]RCW78939.1 cytosine permease [Halanaerobium sp. DL-01]